MQDKLYEATKKEVMSEHEEYVNADVPKQVWVDRNKYLHEHVNKLTDEIIELRKDNKRLTKELNDRQEHVNFLRRSGAI
tara:strand:- start:56 stop:292 length:237 start_codon:yes stop_codon:yes gene_type:complete